MTTDTASLLPKADLIEGQTATVPEPAPRSPNAIEKIFARHHPAIMSDSSTPFEDANGAFKRLRDDNWMLIEELRATMAERDVLLKINAALQTDKDALEQKHRATAAQLGAMMQAMRTAADSVMFVIKEGMKAAAAEPGLAMFAPDGVKVGKIQTENHD